MRNLIMRIPQEKLNRIFFFSFHLFTFAFFLCPSYAVFLVIFYGMLLPSGLLSLLRNPPAWLKNPSLQAAYAFLGYGALTLLSTVTFNPRWSMELWSKTLLTVLFLLTAFAFFREEKNTERYLRLGVFWALLGALISIVKYFITHQEWLRLAPLAQAHNPILGASIYGLFALFALYRLMRETDTCDKVICALAAFVIPFLILLTQSKGPMVATAMGYVLMMMFFMRKNWKGWVVALLMLGVTGLTLSTLHQQTQPTGPTKDHSYMENLAGRGMSYRPQIWAYAVTKIEQSPIFGYGLGAPFELRISPEVTIFHPHNLYLATLYYMGLVGLALELLLLLMMYRNIWHDPDIAWKKFATVVAIYMVLSMGSDIVRLATGPKELMFLFWLPLALFIARDPKRQTTA